MSEFFPAWLCFGLLVFRLISSNSLVLMGFLLRISLKTGRNAASASCKVHQKRQIQSKAKEAVAKVVYSC